MESVMAEIGFKNGLTIETEIRNLGAFLKDVKLAKLREEPYLESTIFLDTNDILYITKLID